MLFMSCAFAVFDYTIKNVTVSKKKIDPGKQINNESNLITKCDNSDAKSYAARLPLLVAETITLRSSL